MLSHGFRLVWPRCRQDCVETTGSRLYIPDDDYRKFIGDRTHPIPGKLVDTAGRVLGAHPGVQFFTVGQRRGLGLNGNTGTPRYVVEIDAVSHHVVLGTEQDLYRKSMWASAVNFTDGHIPEHAIDVTAKIRYKASEALATITPHTDWAEIQFNEPQRAVTPGQAVVFYDDDRMIGGGIIELAPPAGP